MPLPRVAIVGRPNAGKSSLMNLLAKAKVSIVDPTPGVTRDRVSAIVQLEGATLRGHSAPMPRVVEFVDTGGFGVYVKEGARYDEIGNDLTKLTHDIETQIATAVEGADLVLFAIDAQAGPTPRDLDIARLLREQKLGRGKKPVKRKQTPVRVVATKTDGPRWEPHAQELASLGFGEPLLVSSKNNYLRREFIESLYDIVPHLPEEETLDVMPQVKIAIIGKRNAGKSTLVNTLCGESRVIVSEIPGTTRDAIDVHFDFEGRRLAAIDTAGLRRKKSFQDQIEWYAFDRLKLSIDRADVVLLLIDASDAISQVDEQLAMLVQKSYKPVVIVVNKWDAVRGLRGKKGSQVTTGEYEEYIRKELGGLSFAPVSFVSGKDGFNVDRTIRLAIEMFDQSSERVTTGKLNRLVLPIVEKKGPPNKLGSFGKVLYVTQTSTNPPTITLVVNKPDLFTPNYQRFLLNRLREESPFAEVPIKLVIRARKRDEDLGEGAETSKRPAKQSAKRSSKESATRSGKRGKTPRTMIDTARSTGKGEDILGDAGSFFEDDE